MRFSRPLMSATLERRYKRFLADVVLPSGQRLTIHCPNTGAMTGCADPGSRVWYSTSEDPKRKYAHTLEIVETAAGDRIGINSARANAVVEDALREGRIPELASAQWTREVRIPGAKSRFDFRLEQAGGSPCYVEVKSLTLMLDGDWGAFPDAVSTRATRHVEGLARLRESGVRAVLLFCVQHSGVHRVKPADHIDPGYGAALRAAVATGVEVLCYGCRIDSQSICIDRRLPVTL